MITVLITSAQCGHCTKFRGDGIPSSDKEWSPELIRKLLTGRPDKGPYSKMRSEAVIEMFLRTSSNTGDNVSQINEYVMFQSKDEKARNVLGTSLMRIGIKRDGNKILYDVSIDGVSYPDIAEKLHEKYYIQSLPIDLKNKSNDSKVREMYDTFSYWQSKNIPLRIRDLIAFFPTWIFIESDNWEDAILNQNPITGTIVGAEVFQKPDGTYSSRQKVGIREDPDEVLSELIGY